MISIEFPMEVRQVVSRPESSKTLVALPCNMARWYIAWKEKTTATMPGILWCRKKKAYATSFQPALLRGVNTITFDANVAQVGADGKTI
nr:hypothetical protein [Flavisolibacter nicotianae]